MITGFVGASMGWIWNFFVQERFYRNSIAKGQGVAVPEVRLWTSAVGGICFAVGCFCFGWTARPWIHWIVPCIFISLANFGICESNLDWSSTVFSC